MRVAKIIIAAILSAFAAVSAAHADEAGVQPYSAAYAASVPKKRPLLVMVSAAWCKACPRARRTLSAEAATLPVSIAILDYDALTLAQSAVFTADVVPQYHFFWHDGHGWNRRAHAGVMSAHDLREFIRERK